MAWMNVKNIMLRIISYDSVYRKCPGKAKLERRISGCLG